MERKRNPGTLVAAENLRSDKPICIRALWGAAPDCAARLGKNSSISQGRGRQFSLLVRLGLTQILFCNLNDEQRKNFYCPDGRTNSCSASALHPGYESCKSPFTNL